MSLLHVAALLGFVKMGTSTSKCSFLPFSRRIHEKMHHIAQEPRMEAKVAIFVDLTQIQGGRKLSKGFEVNISRPLKKRCVVEF